jgi:predicted dehydrogenase
MGAMSVNAVVRGTGSIGLRHARVLAQHGIDVRLWPVTDRPSPAREQTGLPVLDDASGPAALAAADLVVVAKDTGRHVPDAVQALDAGAGRVLVEKPAAPTAADLEPLLSHPPRAQAWVAAPLRAHHGLQHAIEAAAALGPGRSVRVECQSWLPSWRPERDYRSSYSARADEGGVLRDLVHELDYAIWAFGRPRSVSAALVSGADSVLGIEADEAADLLWVTDDGTAVSTRLDYVSRPGRRRLTVSGSRGRVTWDALTATVLVEDESGGCQECAFPGDLDRDVVMARQSSAVLGTPLVDGHLADAPATLDEAWTTVMVCDLARASAASGRQEEL